MFYYLSCNLVTNRKILNKFPPRDYAITNMHVKRLLEGHDLTRLGFANEISRSNPQKESTTSRPLADIPLRVP